MATDLASYREPLRMLLGSRFMLGRNDASLDAALRLTLQRGLVPGHTLTPGLVGVTPDLMPPVSGTPLALTRLLYHSLLALCAPEMARREFRTRGFEQRFGDALPFIQHLERELYVAETGGGHVFDTWQTYGDFVRGAAGGDWWDRLVAVTTPEQPEHTLHLTGSGASLG